MDDLLLTLKTTFGYGAFRPLQREIIEAALADKDVFALLPTGGGLWPRRPRVADG